MFRAGLYPKALFILEEVTNPGLRCPETSPRKRVDDSHFSMKPVPIAAYVGLREI
jgi:hypothetical protein